MRGWWGGHKVLDPAELEARFSNEDGLGALGISHRDHLDDVQEAQMERVREALRSIPHREADFIELYVFKRRKQTDIAAIFGVSQPTVSYRLKRASARIRYLIELPPLKQGELEVVLKRTLDDPLDVQIMLLMFETTCQSEVAKRLGVSQGLVRHRFLRSIKRLDEAGGCQKYADLFRYVYKNLNMLREVQRPQCQSTMTYLLD